MQILIKTLTGHRQTFDFEPDDKVSHVKQALQQRESIDIEQIRLIYSGRQMKDELTLKDYKISPGATIHMVLQLRGG